MRFITLDPKTFTKFAKKSPYKSFMQAPEIATLREQNGWTPYYLGVEESGELKAATILVAKPTFLGKSIFIAPGGPLLDLEDTKLTNFFFRHLKSYIKSHNGYVLHISPYYELVERGRDGTPVKGGFNHHKAKQNLQTLGFKPITSTQPKYMFALELQNHTPDQLFANLKRNTRNHIRKAEKMGVKIRELKREELGIFKQITASTSERRHFEDRPLSYYEQMYDLFHAKDEVKFIVAEADINETPDNIHPRPLSDDRSDWNERIEDESLLASQGNIDSNPKTPISAAMFMLYGDEVVYLFSGSDEKYMKDYNAQYLIQWYMIKYAAEHKFKTYNFYGIHALPDEQTRDGIYDFKKGFTSDDTGRVIELIGSFELAINQPFYHLHRLLSTIKNHQ